jgi:acyl transferase domain-containing protein
MEKAGGGMLAVFGDRDTVAAELDGQVSIAALNGPRSTIVAGPEPALGSLAERLDRLGLESHRLKIRTAAHSCLLDSYLEDFRAVAEQADHRPLTVPMVSTVTGKVIAVGERLDAGYWVRHMRDTVRFQDAVELLLARYRNSIFLEVGPGAALAGLVAPLDANRRSAAFAVLPGREAESTPAESLLRTVADAWCAGAAVPHSAAGRRVSLPGYPFERVRHWIDSPGLLPAHPAASTTARAAEPSAPGEPPANAEEPSTDVHDRIEAHWRKLLGVAEVRAEDTFFTLGGQSIMAVRLIAALRREFGVTIPMRILINSPTVNGMAEAVEQLRAQATES